MSDLNQSSSPRRALRRISTKVLAGCAGLAAILGTTPTQNAVANGDTRTLTLYHAHTQESITITFRQQGSYDRAALDKLNWFLRDWRKDEPTQMDPRLFDVVWAVWREVGSQSAIRVVSAYRSPDTNNMLRRRSSAVAKNSQHMAGKAMDLHMPDVSMAKVREIGMRLQNGGVGYYPTAGTPFVHLDVGSVRSWPRMPRPQLERLFPDGKTVHLPADGTPLPGYEQAMAEIQSRGGSAFSYADVTSPRRSLWAMLFGGEDEEVEVAQPTRRGRNGRQIAQRPAPRQVASAAPAAGADSSSVYAIGAPAAPAAAPVIVAARTAPTPAPAPAPKQEVAEDAAPARTPQPTAVATLPPPAEDKLPARSVPKLVDMPIPPRRPGDLAATLLASANVPLPPIRPAITAFAEPGATAFAPAPAAPSVDKAALPTAITTASLPDTSRYKPASVPLPPSRPQAAPRQSAPTPDYKVKLDSEALSALVATANADPKRPAKVDTPNMKQAAGGGILAGKFSPYNATSGDTRFTGSLARPVEAAFSRRGD